MISAIDIAPTVLDLANINIPESFQGRSFQILKTKKKFRNYVFAEHNWHDYEAHQRMVTDGKFMYIVNNRPEFPQTGPLDAINSPTYQDLKDASENGSISSIQNDIFVKPRSKEEFYDLDNDPFQFNNLISISKNNTRFLSLKNVLNSWIEETGDDIPLSYKRLLLRNQEHIMKLSLKTDFLERGM